MLEPLSTAIGVVTCRGERFALVKKLRATHPSNRPHNHQHDDRALDVLTEACAFAWAEQVANLGKAHFCEAAGAPDIRICPTGWVEAKAVHPSAKDQQLTKKMREERLIVGGNVQGAGQGLYDKILADFDKARNQLASRDGSPKIIFFNLTSFDVPQWVIAEEEFAEVAGFVDRLAAQDPGIEAVTCYGYNWPQPGRVKFRTN